MARMVCTCEHVVYPEENLRSSLAFVVAIGLISPLVAGVASAIQYDLPMSDAFERVTEELQAQ